MSKVILALSGGLDSTALLGSYLNAGNKMECLFFWYGSKHNEYEEHAVREIVKYYQDKGYNLRLRVINLKSILKFVKSDLLLSGGKIPEGHYEDPEMKQTVVPGRNMLFISIMAAIAESSKIETVGLGVHQGDHMIYPDCRLVFIEAAYEAIRLSSDGNVRISTPFINYHKSEILKLSKSFLVRVPYELTRTCYKNQPVACGVCGSCVERKEAFKIANLTDPIEYETK